MPSPATPAEFVPRVPATGLARLVTWAPSWLISAVIHLVALVLLAWLTVGAELRSAVLVAIVGGAAESFELDDYQAQWTPLLETSHELCVEAPDSSYMGIAAGGLTAIDLAADSETNIEESFAGSATRAAGELFRQGGSALQSTEIVGREAQFYGVKARGNRFVFIVDSSKSMRGYKFEEAKRELLYAIRRLSKDQYFYVIFFDFNAERMVLEPGGQPEPSPVAATLNNIRRLETWVGTVQNELKTHPYEAVKFAMELSPDAVYLLTDGQFTDRGRTTRYLSQVNHYTDDLGSRRPKVVFHTIGFHSREGEELLREIAKKYGGTYQFVAPPGRL